MAGYGEQLLDWVVMIRYVYYFHHWVFLLEPLEHTSIYDLRHNFVRKKELLLVFFLSSCIDQTVIICYFLEPFFPPSSLGRIRNQFNKHSTIKFIECTS